MDCKIPFETIYSEELQKAVGLLFLTAASSETTLGFQIARLAAHPGTTNVRLPFLFAGMDLKVKLMKVEELSQLINPSMLPAIQKITEKIRRQFDHRNVIAHNFAMASGTSLHIQQIKLTRAGMKGASTFNAGQITRVARTLYGRVRQLGGTLDRYGIMPLPESFGPDGSGLGKSH